MNTADVSAELSLSSMRSVLVIIVSLSMIHSMTAETEVVTNCERVAEQDKVIDSPTVEVPSLFKSEIVTYVGSGTT